MNTPVKVFTHSFTHVHSLNRSLVITFNQNHVYWIHIPRGEINFIRTDDKVREVRLDHANGHAHGGKVFALVNQEVKMFQAVGEEDSDYEEGEEEVGLHFHPHSPTLKEELSQICLLYTSPSPRD